MLKKRKARGKPALDTVSIFFALSINIFLISSVLLPPPPVATPGGFWVVFAVAFSTATALLALAFESLLLLGVEVTAAVEVSLLSCTSPSCWGDKEKEGEEEGGHIHYFLHRLHVHETRTASGHNCPLWNIS